MDLMQPSWHKLVVIDVETTGVNPFRHQIVSLAIVPLESDKPNLELYVDGQELVWQERALSYFAGFRSAWESNAVSPQIACDHIAAYLSQYFETPVTAVGHNIGFDIAFLRQLAFRAGRDEIPFVSHRAVDTHTILYLLHMQGIVPEVALTSSGALEFFEISIPADLRHSAIGDAIATRELFKRAVALLLRSEFSWTHPSFHTHIGIPRRPIA